MDNTFEVEFPEQNFAENICANKVVTNEFGTWFVDVVKFPETNKDVLKLTVTFAPIRAFSEAALRNVGIDSSFEYADGGDTCAAVYQCGNTPRYEFIFDKDEDLDDSEAYDYGSIFKIKVEINASSLSDSSKDMVSHTKEIYEAKKFNDVTIKTADRKELTASKFILSRSSVFDAMLNRHDTKEAQEGVIEINDIQHEVMAEIIRYLYTNEVPKLSEMALDLIVAADKYDLKGLVKECEWHLIENITLENFGKILMIGDMLHIEALKKEALDFIICKRDVIFKTAAWKTLKESISVEISLEITEELAEYLN